MGINQSGYSSFIDFSIATYLSTLQGVPSENFNCVQAAED